MKKTELTYEDFEGYLPQYDFDESQKRFFKEAFEIIMHNKDTSKVTCFADRPGIGKSTLIKTLMHCCIGYHLYKGQYEPMGLIVITDSMKRLEGLSDGKKDRIEAEQCWGELFEDWGIKYHYKEFEKNVIVLKSDVPFLEQLQKQHYKPIVLMSTQRYFMLSEQVREQLFRFNYNNKPLKRNIVIFDECPYFSEVVTMNSKNLTDIESAFYEGLSDEEENKRFVIREFKIFKERLLDQMDEKEDLTKDNVTLYWKDERYPTITPNDTLFFEVVEKNRESLTQKYNAILKDLQCLKEIAENGAIFNFIKKKKSDKYERSIILVRDNRESFYLGQDKKFFVFDATCDIDPRYDLDYVEIISGEKYNKPLKMTITNVKMTTSKNVLCNGRDQSFKATNAITNYLKNKIHYCIDKQRKILIVTYRNLFQRFSKEFDYVGYFGNLKGFNDFKDFNKMAHIGMNRYPSLVYFYIYCGCNMDIYRGLKNMTEDESKKFFKSINLNFDSIQFSPSSSGSSGGSNSKTNKTSNNTVIDWISKKLDRLNDKISLTQAKYENLVDTLGKNRGKKKKKLAKNSDGLLEAQIENLDEQIKLYDKLAKNEKTAIKRYDKKAKSVKLSGSLKKAVRNGKIGTKKTSMKTLIHTYGEKKAKKIQEYEQWYDAARNAEKEYESARASSRKKTEEKYQIQADAAQAKISMYQSQAANAADDYKTQNYYLEEQRELIKKNYDMQIAIADLNKDTVLAAELQAQKAEELAQIEKQKFDNIQASSYENEIKQEQGMLETYKAEKAELEKQIKTIPKGTEEWYRAKEAINKCDVEIINCTASAAELNNKITEIANNAKTALQNAFATMASEGDLFAELMSIKDMFDSETGIITKEGLATLGTYGNGYNVSKASAEMDHSLIKMLQAGLNHDFNKSAYSFIDSNNEKRVYNSLDQLEDAVKEVYEDWREQIKNTFEYESKIIDMMRDKLENELSALKDLIDAKKSALQAERDLYTYRKQIKETTSNISLLSKQITAVKGDTSEAGIARIQKLQNELKQQEENLAEQEYDHLIQAEQDMLDNLYDEYSDLITSEMQDTRRLLDKGFRMIESSTDTINQTIKDYSGRYDYTPEYNNHMNSGSSGDILNDAKDSSDARNRRNGYDPSQLIELFNSNQNKISLSETKEQKPKGTKSNLISVRLFTKDELKKLKPKVEKIFDNKKLYKKGTSDGTAINDFLYKENGKVLTSKALEKLRKICGTNDNNVMFDVLKSISNTIGDIKNVKGFKDGGIAKLVKSKGEDGIGFLQNGEGFVKPEHVGEVKKLMDALPQIRAAMNYQIDIPKMLSVSLPVPQSTQMNQKHVEIKNINLGNVTLPNVTNYEEFRDHMFNDMQKNTKFEKMLQSMTIDKITTPQHNRFSKNRISF